MTLLKCQYGTTKITFTLHKHTDSSTQSNVPYFLRNAPAQLRMWVEEFEFGDFLQRFDDLIIIRRRHAHCQTTTAHRCEHFAQAVCDL